MKTFTRCDSEGVPKVVQSIVPKLTGWEVKLFNGWKHEVDYDLVPPGICHDSTMYRVENHINNNIKEILKL